MVIVRYEGGLIMGDGQVGKTEDENRTLLRTKATRAKKQMFRNRPTVSPYPSFPISSQTKCLSEMEIKLKESEKKTLWQIDECQKIIVQKVNKEYVDSAN
jgi:hypothetical protein